MHLFELWDSLYFLTYNSTIDLEAANYTLSKIADLFNELNLCAPIKFCIIENEAIISNTLIYGQYNNQEDYYRDTPMDNLDKYSALL